LLAAVVVACSSPADEANLPIIDTAAFQERLAASEQPLVVNVWASWCLPCRDEAPVLSAAHAEFGDRVAFIGVAFNDNQPGAREFLAEFDLPFPHYFDQHGELVAEFGGFAMPRTYFLAPGGDLVASHSGALDAETLERLINELLSR
jgi:cytochrome c biogenesis protein CcmG/thiol:disulfide interchange protein DsbE